MTENSEPPQAAPHIRQKAASPLGADTQGSSRLRRAAEIAGLLGVGLVLITLGAHFFRAGEYGIFACLVGSLPFLCMKPAWKQYALAFLLFWGTAEWVDTAYGLARFRMQMEMPWGRAAAIVLIVALATALAGVFIFSRARRKTRHASEEFAFLQGIAFICTFLALLWLRRSSPMPFLLLERYLPLWGAVEILFASWYAAVVAGLLADPGKSRKTRTYLWLFFGCLFFVQFGLGVLGINGMLLTGKLHVPIPAFIIFAPVFRESFSVMPIIVAASVLLAGNAWCSLLCYFGPFDALAAGKRPVRPYPKPLSLMLRYGRQSVLILGVAAALLLRGLDISTGAAVSAALAFALVSLLIMAVLSRRYGGLIHCTAFCPMGLAVNWLGRLSPWRIRVNAGICDHCGACEKICAYAAITHKSRSTGKVLPRCSLCRDCVGVCPHRAISLRCPGLSSETAWKAFAGLLAVLHALFLAIAMV